MAWSCSGIDNDAMVSNLKRFGIISSLSVEEAFRDVDRKFFVPKTFVGAAHIDRPLRDGNVHISAPHIYGSVCEALEFPKDGSLSFLNAGSGTGYLTCIAASIMGERACHYNVELHSDVLDHCKQAVHEWQSDFNPPKQFNNISFFEGNALEIDPCNGEGHFGFDRIYIGAAIEGFQLKNFTRLLKPGGILVGPVDDELVKIVRSHCATNAEFSREILAEVNFATLLAHPSKATLIPARIWEPSCHMLYPRTFRDSCNAVLLCAQAEYHQPNSMEVDAAVNVASLLPKALWIEIFSYLYRDWFEVYAESEGETSQVDSKHKEAEYESMVVETFDAEKYSRRAEVKKRALLRLAHWLRPGMQEAYLSDTQMTEIENV